MAYKKPVKRKLSIGPYHPLLEEAEQFILTLEGETVTEVEWNTGYNHRAIEKLSEGKNFEQVIFLVERICGICSTSHPIAYVNCIDELTGIEAPERAKYIRTLIGELERLHSHYLWLGLAGHFLGYNTLFMWAWKHREPILEMFEMISGNRNHYAMMTIGGVRRDIDSDMCKKLGVVLDDFSKKNDMLIKAALDDPILTKRLKGVGVLTREDAIKWATVGPVARASGVAIDVRKDDPYDAYGLVDWNIIVQEDGDVLAKTVVRLLECIESVKIIKQCIDKLGKVKGPIQADVKEVPPGEGCGHHEAPRGETFHYVRSDGGNSPVRHKIRAPSYTNIPSFEASCPGETIADVALTLASVDPCYCCTERMLTVREHPETDWNYFVKLSQEKTHRMIKGE